jgi:phage gpG-like protein
MIGVQVGNKTAEAFAAKLKRVTGKVQDLTQAHARISALLSKWVLQNFATEGGLVGGWVPFKHGGRIKNGKLDTSAKLLQDTGHLRQSFHPFYSRKNAGIGSELPYAIKHEFGMGALPARRMLPKADDVRDTVKTQYDVAIREASK